jgi:hypothetical protein
MQEMLPPDVFARSLQLISSNDAVDYLSAVIAAIAERGNIDLHVPERLRGKKIWIPIGNGTVPGSPVSSREGEWGLVSPGGSSIHLTGVKPLVD